MWFADLSPYAYGCEPEPGRLAVGWLDSAQPYERGAVGPEPVHQRFVEVLRWGAVHRPVDRYRGFHHCDLDRCADPARNAEEEATSTSHDQRASLGSAQIEVEDGAGRRFVAPDLIVHYVEAHGYRPPDAFVRAALVGEWRAPERHPGAFRFVGPGLTIDEWAPELASVLWDELAAHVGAPRADIQGRVRVEVRPTEVVCVHTHRGLPSVAVVVAPVAARWSTSTNWLPTVPGTHDLAAWIADTRATMPW